MLNFVTLRKNTGEVRDSSIEKPLGCPHDSQGAFVAYLCRHYGGDEGEGKKYFLFIV